MSIGVFIYIIIIFIIIQRFISKVHVYFRCGVGILQHNMGFRYLNILKSERSNEFIVFTKCYFFSWSSTLFW